MLLPLPIPSAQGPITETPADVLLEIFRNLNLEALLICTKINKGFRQLLTDATSPTKHIWKGVLKREGIPPCPDGRSLSRYLVFLLGPACKHCGREGEDVLPLYALGGWLCSSCLGKRAVTSLKGLLDGDEWAWAQVLLCATVTGPVPGRKTPRAVTHYLLSDVKTYQKLFKEQKDTVDVFLYKHRNDGSQIKSLASRCDAWYGLDCSQRERLDEDESDGDRRNEDKDMEARRQRLIKVNEEWERENAKHVQERAAIKERALQRYLEIVDHLAGLGYEDDVKTMGQSELGEDILSRVTTITKTVWNESFREDVLERLNEHRIHRLAHRDPVLYLRRFAVLAKFVGTQPGEKLKLVDLLMNTRARTILEVPDAVSVTEDYLRKHLGPVLPSITRGFKREGLCQVLDKTSQPGQPNVAVSLLVCAKCGLVGMHQAILGPLHDTCLHQKLEIPSREKWVPYEQLVKEFTSRSRWSVDSVSRFPMARGLNKVVEEMGFNPLTATVKDMEATTHRVICRGCEETTESIILMDWKQAVEHVVQNQDDGIHMYWEKPTPRETALAEGVRQTYLKIKGDRSGHWACQYEECRLSFQSKVAVTTATAGWKVAAKVDNNATKEVQRAHCRIKHDNSLPELECCLVQMPAIHLVPVGSQYVSKESKAAIEDRRGCLLPREKKAAQSKAPAARGKDLELQRRTVESLPRKK